MQKREWIILCSVIMIPMLVLAGCSRTNITKQEGDDTGEAQTETQLETELEVQTSVPADTQTAISTPTDTASQYLKIAELSGNKWNDAILYSEERYCIYNGTYYGFITEDGEEITPYIYEEASPFSEGLACVRLDGKYGYIGKNGETVLLFLYDQAAPFSEGLAYFSKGEEYGFMDREGNVVLRPDCDSVSSFREGYAYYSVDGRYGYLDKSGRIVTEAIYDDAGYFYNGTALVMKNGRYGAIGGDGTEILPPEYDEIHVEATFLFAKRDELVYCFDKDGKPYLSEGWEDIDIKEGLFCVKRNQKYGLLDGNGNVILESRYERLAPIPGKKLVIACENGNYGVLDYEGNRKVPFIYEWIGYQQGTLGDGLIVAQSPQDEKENSSLNRKYGYLSGEDLSEKIPLIYDYMSSFVGGRAVVKQNEKYGIMREDGTLEYSIQYDKAKIFDSGSMALWTAAMAELFDSRGNRIVCGAYDNITECGSYYQIEKGGHYGFLDREGETVVPPAYSYCQGYEVYGARHIYLMTEYRKEVSEILVKTDAYEEGDLRKAILQNHITPRVGQYAEWLQNRAFQTDADDRDGGIPLATETDETRGYYKFSKLYRLEKNGDLLLYFYMEPYIPVGFPLSYSGFYTVRDGKIVNLMTGFECGGSARGDCICLWYDTEQSRCLTGLRDACGGFGGFSYGGQVYEIRNGEAVECASFYTTSQTAYNYKSEVLRDNAGLFYDGENHPYTAESIAEASAVTEYEVDGERTTWENYEKTYNRYQYLSPLDQDFY